MTTRADAIGTLKLPPYFITFDHALPLGRRASSLRALGSTDLMWQVRESVADLNPDVVRLMRAIKVGEPIPDVLLHNDVLIVSTKLREAIENWLQDYEFLPAKLELWDEAASGSDLTGGPVIEGYWWLNCWRRLDIVDWHQTEASYFGEFRPGFSYPHTPVRASAFQRLALKHPVPEGEHFYGLLGIEGEQRYLSASLHKHLLACGLLLKFRPVFFERGVLPAGARDAAYNLLNPSAEQT